MGPVTYPERITGEVGTYERWDPPRHEAAFVELCADAEVMRFLGGPQPPAVSREISRVIADHWTSFGFGLWACLHGDRCFGFSGACRPGPQWDEAFPGEVEIGWRLARAAWGRGFATEGARLALAAGAQQLGLERMVAFVDPDNDRSQAVVRRLDMGRLTTTVNARLGAPVDVFAITLPQAQAA